MLIAEIAPRFEIAPRLHLRERVLVRLEEAEDELVDGNDRAGVKVGLAVVLVRVGLLEPAALEELAADDAGVLLRRLEDGDRVVGEEVPERGRAM